MTARDPMFDVAVAWIFIWVMVAVIVYLFTVYVREWRMTAAKERVERQLGLEVGLVAAVEAIPRRPSAYKVRQARTLARRADVVTYADLAGAPVGELEPIETFSGEVTQ